MEGAEMSNHQEVKKAGKSSFLLNLLCWIDRGESRATMAKLLNFSKQRLSYHIGTLRQKGLIEEVQKKPISLYRLTPLGQRVKENIGQSVDDFYHKNSIWRCHNLILGWEIRDFGTWQFNDRLTKAMKGWHYQEILLSGHKVHIQSSGLLKVYCPEVYAVNADEGFDAAVQAGQKVVDYLKSKFNLQLGERYRIRHGQKEHFGSENMAEFIGHMKIGGVFIDISDKQNRRLEADQDNYQLEKLFALPDILDKKLVPAIDQHSQDIRLHLAAIQEIRNAVRELRDAVKELRGDNHVQPQLL